MRLLVKAVKSECGLTTEIKVLYFAVEFEKQDVVLV